MSRNILILQGHPDPSDGHLCHALADAYSQGTAEGGHNVRRISIAKIGFPLLKNAKEFEQGALPETLKPAAEAIQWADHVVLFFPLWTGMLPAVTKAFLEQVFRPGIAFRYRDKAMPEKLLAGKSARIVVTMGMPAVAYRVFFRAHGVKALTRSIFGFVGFHPVKVTYFGGAGDVTDSTLSHWLGKMRALGREAQ